MKKNNQTALIGLVYMLFLVVGVGLLIVPPARIGQERKTSSIVTKESVTTEETTQDVVGVPQGTNITIQVNVNGIIAEFEK